MTMNLVNLTVFLSYDDSIQKILINCDSKSTASQGCTHQNRLSIFEKLAPHRTSTEKIEKYRPNSHRLVRASSGAWIPAASIQYFRNPRLVHDEPFVYTSLHKI